jgi:hypothetical protein
LLEGQQVLLEHSFVGGQGHGQRAQVTQVRFAPVGRALVVITQTQEEGLQPLLGAFEILDGVGAGTAQIADGFVDFVGHVDGGEFASA